VLRLVQGSGFRLPFRDGSFDIVMSMGVIEHFSADRTHEMLLEHARVCRPGGRVIVSVPNALDIFHTAVRGMKGRSYPYYPERSYTPWGLGRALRRAGLAPAEYDGYGPLWSLRQHWLGYLLIAPLHKARLLQLLNRLQSGRVLSCIGTMTIRVGVRPAVNEQREPPQT
jgi:SAM-dependent methyltransferase